jgi:hypothetical protein
LTEREPRGELDGMEPELLAVLGSTLGMMLGSAAVGFRWVLRHLRELAASQGDELAKSLSRDMKRTTPDPDEQLELDRSPGEEIMQAFGRVVHQRVAEALGPVEHRLNRIEEDVALLLDAESIATRRQAEHSDRLEAVEATTGAYPIVEVGTFADNDEPSNPTPSHTRLKHHGTAG